MKKYKTVITTLSIAAIATMATCSALNASEKMVRLKNGEVVIKTHVLPYKQKEIDGSAAYKRKGHHYGPYLIDTKADKTKYHFGRKATSNEIKAWNIDVMPDGTGLPEGRGTVDEGEALYEKKCQMCHGDFGTGGKGFPPLAGGDVSTLKNQLLDPNEGDEPPVKTIGSYWPYASTIFWYVKSGMPFPHPLTLTDNEVYALTAYLLNVNDITFKNGDDIEYLDKNNFKNIVMPNHDGFYPDVDGPHAKQNIKKFMADPTNYGNVTYRCMKNCIKGKVPVVRIKNEINDFNPPMSTERSWGGLDWVITNAGKKESFGAKIYKKVCSACHSNKAIGAPLIGDKEAWSKVLAKGLDKVYENGIKGVGAMPPKGGTNLSDKDFKKVVDYIISQSK